MAIPKTTTVCKNHLFTDPSELIRLGIPDIIQARIMRLRNVFTYWNTNVNLCDREIVEYMMYDLDVSQSTAYEDIRIVKEMLGDINAAKKSYHRYRFNQMITDLIIKAKEDGDNKTVERAIATYARYNMLEQPDEKDIPYDEIVVQPFDITDDPSTLGIKKIVNIKDTISRLEKKYGGAIVDVKMEEVDFNHNLNEIEDAEID